MDFIIRDVTIEDYESINQLSYELYHLHFIHRPDIFRDTSLCFSYEHFQKELKDSLTKIIVVDYNSTIIGYAYIKYIQQSKSLLCNERHFISIYDFVVSKHYQSQGVGKRLHQEIVQFAREQNCQRIELDVWEFNQQAIQFYQNLGYSNKNRKMEIEI